MKRVPDMELETPLRPRAVAEGVWEEASVWLEQPLPRRWIGELIAKANTIYAHDPRFRRKLRAKGDSGREWLWIFTHRQNRALKIRPFHVRLPASNDYAWAAAAHFYE